MHEKTMYNIIRDTFKRMEEISRQKGQEYTGGADSNIDRLSNFKQGGARLDVHPMKYLMFGLDKHFNSVATYVREHSAGIERELSEPIEGRIDDLILYAILLKCLILEERGVGPIAGMQVEEVVGPCSSDGLPEGHWERNLYVTGPAPRDLDRGDLGVTDPRPGDEADDSITSLQRLIVSWASSAFPARSIDTVRMKLTNHELPELMLDLGLKRYEKAEDEIADVMILLLDLCVFLNIDLNRAIRQKMVVNAGREWIIDANGISSHKKVK